MGQWIHDVATRDQASLFSEKPRNKENSYFRSISMFKFGLFSGHK